MCRGYDELAELGIESLRVEFPKGMDANEYAQKVQPASKALGAVLSAAESMGRVIAEQVARPP